MNTLIADLRGELDRYLTVVEDNLLNYQANDKTKNIKTAVKLRDWRSILYYLYRYDFQIDVVRDAYFGACYIGDLSLMKLFFQPNNMWEYDALKYFVCGGQNALLEQYRKQYPEHYTSLIYCGLLKIGKVDDVKLKKYGELEMGGMFVLSYAIGKYNTAIDNDAQTVQRTILGKIRSRKYFTMDDYNSLGLYSNTDVVRELARCGWHDECNLILEKEPKKYSEYLEGLISGRWVEKFEAHIAKKDLHPYTDHAISYYYAKMAIMTDNLELFRQNDEILNPLYAISLMVDAKAFKILEYGLGNYIRLYTGNRNVSEYIDSTVETTGDPRIANLLAKKLDQSAVKYFVKVRCNF